MFRASVREFAEGEIRQRVEEMDEQAHLDEAVTRQCFELGLMGIETPEEFGGAGGSFFQAILAVEELSRVDASVGVLVDVQNTLVNNALIRWGSADQKRSTWSSWQLKSRRLCVERGSLRLGCVCHADAGS